MNHIVPLTEYSTIEKSWIEEGLIDLSVLDVKVDLKYSHNDNIFQSKLYTEFSRPFGHKILYEALKNALNELKNHSSHLTFLLWDTLRPHAIQELMWDRFEHEEKAKYIAHPSKSSIHNYGMAVDLTLYDTKLHKVLPMGSDFDDFSDASHVHYPHLTSEEKENRALLRTVMIQSGFIPYENEWWHYEAKDKNIIKSDYKRY